MKKGFRWIPALVILILTMLFSAAAMAESSGEEEKVRDTVEKLCSGIQNYDAQQISSCLKNPSSLTYVSEENAPYVNRFIRENNKQMFRYTVRELSVNGEKAAYPSSSGRSPSFHRRKWSERPNPTRQASYRAIPT